MSQFDRNHDGAALGASHHVPVEDQRTVYPYTVQGGATMPDREAQLRRQNMIHTTYLYLGVAVAGCMAGAWWGSHSVAFLEFFFSLGTFGFLGIFLALNMIPQIALAVSKMNPRLAVLALAADGVFAGLTMAPLVFLGLAVSGSDASQGGNLVSTAMVVTGAIFASVTAYVFLNKKEIRPSKAMLWGVLGFFAVAVPLSIFSVSSTLHLIISGLAGLLGVYQVAVGTSELATNPRFNNPVAGALILFAGVFNIFTTVLHLLLAGGRD